jgi:group I intron endonuclease
LINGKQYIGSGVDLYNRLRFYFCENNLKRHPSMAICRALLKYGYSNFSLEILEYCDKDKALILSREQYYLDLLKPEYNILKIAGSSLGRNHSEKSRGKISASLLGIPKSEETRAKMSASKKGIPKSEETKAKMGA